MNEVRLLGRLTKDPEGRDTATGKVVTYQIAVDRYNAKKQKREADYIKVTAFGRNALFAEKWLHQGDPVVVYGSIKTGNYTNKEGKRVYTTDIWVDKQEFVPTRKQREGGEPGSDQIQDDDFFTKLANEADDFVKIPDDVSEESLPFN